MEEQKRKSKSRRGMTKIIPPKKAPAENLSLDEVRSINKKKNHRKRKVKRIMALCAFALAVICAGVALVLTVFFRIDNIQIKIDGTRLYGDKEIIACCGVEIGDNLFMVSEKKINETLTLSMPYIKSVTIERELPDTLIIKVVSATSAAAIPYGDGYVVIDPDGKVLDNNAPKVPDGVPKVNGLKAVEPVEGKMIDISGDGNKDDLLEITMAIRDSGIEDLTEINFVRKGCFELKYDDRIVLKLGDMTNVFEKIDLAKSTIDSKQSDPGFAYFVGTFNLSIEGQLIISASGNDNETEAEDAEATTDESGDIISSEEGESSEDAE